MSGLLKEKRGESGGLGQVKNKTKTCVGKAKGAKGVRFKKKVGEARVAGARPSFQHLGSRAWWVSVRSRPADIESMTPVKTTQ